MTETINEKLDWVIPLLKKWKDGGELRNRNSAAGEWKPWKQAELPMFCDPQENYCVLPKWAWELVDAERDGKTIQFDFKCGGWGNVSTKQCCWNMPPECYRIKPDPEPVRAQLTEADFDQLGWWEIHWTSGGVSKAVISQDCNGSRCIMCANWITGPFRLSTYLEQIKEAYLMYNTDDSTDATE